MKSKLKSLASKTIKPKKPSHKVAYALAMKLMDEMDDTEKF